MQRTFFSTFDDKTEGEFKTHIQSGRPPMLGSTKKFKTIRVGDIIVLRTKSHVFGVAKAISRCSDALDLMDREIVYKDQKFNKHHILISSPVFFHNKLSNDEMQELVGGSCIYATNIYKGVTMEFSEAFVTIPCNKKRGTIKSKPRDELSILSKLSIFLSTHI